MSETALRLQEQVLQLSADDRQQLANALWDSLEGEGPYDADADKAAWIAELERRSAEADADPSRDQPFREAIAELRRELA